MRRTPRSALLRRRLRTRTAVAGAIGAVLAGGATVGTLTAAANASSASPDIHLSVVNPRPHDVAGRHGDFTVDLVATARNANGNQLLNAHHGYRPGINLPPAHTFGPGLPDPDAPGLVVTLSSTPAAAGGPHANLAGVFQLNTVSRQGGMQRIVNDWEVGVPGFFGTNKQVQLTAYLVRGTAPGMVTGHETPISNVVHETFTIG